ncbi:hypothetical protein Q3G72_023761 [Acer saccharum]|nr:hypothetical protein Q3G72_023761 [Acer saccharum]
MPQGIVSWSYNFGKLAVSNDALKSSYDAKNQLLLILIETLDLENLLQMVHDETPFRGPVAGYRSVLRTFISAFIAAYEINLQLADGTPNLILDILCKIYHGEVCIYSN